MDNYNCIRFYFIYNNNYRYKRTKMIHCLEIDGVLLEINNKPILSNIYLQTKTNLVTGIFGRNGAGKSSLMKVIFGALDCEYSLRVDSKSIKSVNKRNDFISFLPQFNFIPNSLSIKQTLYYFELNSNIFETILPEFINKTKMKIGELSGGQRRFIELYIILFSKSKFALLDEPFSQLSPLQIEKAKELILKTKSKKGILITDHLYNHILDISDTNYILKDGKSYVVNSLLDLEELGYIKVK